jgi:hypothetical protein
MSPTVLEVFVLLVLLFAAWQLGILLAPVILRELRSMQDSLDDVSEEQEQTAEEEQAFRQRKKDE